MWNSPAEWKDRSQLRVGDKIFPRGDVSNKPLPGVSLIWPIFISIVARMTMERGKAISVRSYQGNFERNAPLLVIKALTEKGAHDTF